MSSSSIDTVRIVYILYIVGVFVSALMFVGVILAYIERGKITDSWLGSHVDKQIRIFWIWLITLVVLALIVGICLLALPATFEIFAGDSVVAMFAGIGILFALPILVVLGLSAYVLTSSIASLKTLDKSE